MEHNSPSRETESRPGTGGSPRSAMRALVKHPQTFQRSQHPQHPGLTANQNSRRQFDPDHPESGRLYKPARSSIQQDSTIRSRRGSFSGSGLSSPALQRSHRDSFSGSPAGLTRNVPLTGTPSGLTKKVSLTDPVREGRIAGGLRPGPVQPHLRAACPDTRLEIDAAPPEAAAVSRAERPLLSWTSPNLDSWSPLRAQNPLPGVDLGHPGAIHTNGPGIALQRYTGPGSAHLTPDAGVNNVLPLFMNKKRCDGNINRRSCDDAIPSLLIVGERRPAIPSKLGPCERNPRPTPPDLCFLAPISRER